MHISPIILVLSWKSRRNTFLSNFAEILTLQFTTTYQDSSRAVVSRRDLVTSQLPVLNVIHRLSTDKGDEKTWLSTWSEHLNLLPPGIAARSLLGCRNYLFFFCRWVGITNVVWISSSKKQEILLIMKITKRILDWSRAGEIQNTTIPPRYLYLFNPWSQPF